MTFPSRTALAVIAALAAVGCGSDEEGDPIPQEIASSIESQLVGIENRIANGSVGACADIGKDDDSGTLAEIERQLGAMPDGVDQDTANALDESVRRLEELVQQECDEIAEEEPETEPPPEEPPPTTDTEPEPEPEESIPTEPPPEEEEEEPPVEEPDDGGPGGGEGPDGTGPPGQGGGLPVPGDDG